MGIHIVCVEKQSKDISYWIKLIPINTLIIIILYNYVKYVYLEKYKYLSNIAHSTAYLHAYIIKKCKSIAKKFKQ